MVLEPVFRPAGNGDINSLCAGLERAFVPLLEKYYKSGYYAYFTNPSWVRDKIGKGFVYVCELNLEVVGGIIILKAPDETSLKLHTVYVDEAHRRKGLAAFLIKNAEAALSGAKVMKLETLSDLEGNIKLYEKLGYRSYGEPKVTENNLAIVYYMKNLSRDGLERSSLLNL
jgi:hypothetical protein